MQIISIGKERARVRKGLFDYSVLPTFPNVFFFDIGATLERTGGTNIHQHQLMQSDFEFQLAKHHNL